MAELNLDYGKDVEINFNDVALRLDPLVDEMKNLFASLGVQTTSGRNKNGVKNSGYAPFDNALADALDVVKHKYYKGMTDFAIKSVREMREKTPVHTGNLQDSLTVDFSGMKGPNSNKFEIGVGVDMDKLKGPKTLKVRNPYYRKNKYEQKVNGAYYSNIPNEDYVPEAEEKTRKVPMFASVVWKEILAKNFKRYLE